MTVILLLHKVFRGWWLTPSVDQKGSENRTVYESLIVCFSFALPIAAILSFNPKK